MAGSESAEVGHDLIRIASFGLATSLLSQDIYTIGTCLIGQKCGEVRILSTEAHYVNSSYNLPEKNIRIEG